MTFSEFCQSLAHIDGLNHTEKALAVLWWHKKQNSDSEISAGELARMMEKEGLGKPNSTLLGKSIQKTKLTIKGKTGFKLKAGADTKVYSWLSKGMQGIAPPIDLAGGYLPEAVWVNTKPYIEHVCKELNGCYQYTFYDSAFVMLRRLVETLIIECYEHLGRAQEIKKDNEYWMLSGLIDHAILPTGLHLGREAKRKLGEIKDFGDRSAHNRYWQAHKADMDKVQSSARVVADELINIASLKKAPTK